MVSGINSTVWWCNRRQTRFWSFIRDMIRSALAIVVAGSVLLLTIISSCNAQSPSRTLLANWMQTAPTPPQLPKFYTVSGSIELPYAEISEPFTAYVDNELRQSRIDYYNGMVRNYQFGNASHTGFLLHPVSDEKQQNRRDCVRFGSVTAAQNVLPDTSTGFTFNRVETVRGVQCNVFVNKTVYGDRVNTYTIWFGQKDSKPYRYDMIGYDSLLGSHYDRYYVEYLQYDATKRPTPADFEVKTQDACHVLPSAASAAALHPEMNPMAELIHADDSNTELHFNQFTKTHVTDGYPNVKEHRVRLHTFRNNLRYINSKNRAALTYRLAVNHLADRSAEELRPRQHCRRHSGRLQANPRLRANQLSFNTNSASAADLPDSVDWRIAGAVSPVKDQGICGSCWSFGTAGVMEGAYFVKTGKRVRFSQQQLVDCSWGYGNNGCNGGDDVPSYSYIQKHGLAQEQDYGKYLMQDGYCHADKVNTSVKVTGFVKVPQNNATALKMALFKNGPVSVAIDASHLSFVFYSTGVYYEKQCSSTELDHAVLAVGYGVYKNEPYWLIKNSWSFYWGNNGYVLMSMRDNNCGVMTAATQPVIA